MKATSALCISIVFGLMGGLFEARAQAPVSLAGSFYTINVQSGAAPFVSSGKYRLFLSTLGSNYVVLGNAGTGFSSGTYVYSRTATNTGSVTFTDFQSGPAVSLQLAFSDSATGTAAFSAGAGNQNGTFAATNYASLGGSSIVAPEIGGNLFQAYVGGQPGFAYSIQTSTDLLSWSAVTNVALSDISGPFSDTLSTARHFYRAKAVSTQFVPSAITNETFNFTVTEGSVPLATNGVWQWMTGSNNNSYQIIGGPGATNSSGVYTFTASGGDSASVALFDSVSGTLNGRLYFTSPNAGYCYLTNATGFQSDKFIMGPGVLDFLGNVTVIPDLARSGSLSFAADGNPASLSVTNASGWIWTLSLPADALVTPRTITMIPTASVDSSNALIKVSNGVQLEPDGLQFSDGVILSVQPPAPLGAHGSLMMAGDDGSSIFFVDTTNQANVYSTVIFHFTMGGASDSSDQDWNNFLNNHFDEAYSAYVSALARVKSLERVVSVPSEPPDYELTCDTDANAANDAAADAYEKSLFSTENDAIQQLLSATRTLILLTGNETYEAPAISEARTLVETAMFRKAEALFSRYNNNPKKVETVVRVLLGVAKQDALLGGPSSNESHFLNECETMVQNLLNYDFDQLRNAHDYSKVTVLIDVEHQLELLGGGNDTSFFQDLANALTFKLTVDNHVVAGVANVEARGDVTVQADPGAVFPLTGSGSINYLSSTLGSAVLVGGQSFAENVKIDNFDACKAMTLSIHLDRLGADTETYELDGQEVGLPGVLQSSSQPVFTPYRSDDGTYAFTVPIQNKSAQAVSQTIVRNGNGGSGTVTLTLTLQHTPK